MTRLLMVMPYYDGDKIEMERVADLAADLLDQKTEQCDLLFAGRFDASYPSPEILEHTREKFRNVSFWRCMRIGWGHPDGCSQLAYGIIQFILDQRKTNTGYTDIDAFLLMESDAIFTRKTWIEELSNAWEIAKQGGKHVCGAIQPQGRWGHDVETHVNALALYHPDLLEMLPGLNGGPVEIGWDYFQRHRIMPLAANTSLMKLDWKKPTISKEELFEQNSEVLVYHGVKDQSALQHVREKYNL